MNHIVRLSLLCCFVFFPSPSFAQQQSVADLIAEIGDSDRFETRQAASERLVQLGPEVLPAIQAAQKSSSLERRERALRIEAEILDNLAWTPRNAQFSFKNGLLSEVFKQFADTERMDFCFGDWSGRTAGPEDLRGNWQANGTPWDAIESICAKSNTFLQPIGRSGHVRLCAIERPAGTYPVVCIENGIRFVLQDPPEKGENPSRYVLRIECFGDAERAICAGSQEAYVLNAVTDTGEVLKRVRGFELGTVKTRSPELNRHMTYARLAPPTRKCARLARLELEIILVCFGFPERLSALESDTNLLLAASDETKWRYQGYHHGDNQTASLSFIVSESAKLKNILSSPRFFVSDENDWRESVTTQFRPALESGWIAEAHFAPPSFGSAKRAEVLWYTRLIERRFMVVFENLPFPQ